jgi:NADPH oxidase
MESSEFLTIRIYFTEKMATERIKNIMLNQAGSDIDYMTQLNAKTTFGRPNWPHLFADVKHHVYRQRVPLRARIGVFFCGNAVLGKRIQKECHAQSDAAVTFTFRQGKHHRLFLFFCAISSQ